MQYNYIFTYINITCGFVTLHVNYVNVRAIHNAAKITSLMHAFGMMALCAAVHALIGSSIRIEGNWALKVGLWAIPLTLFFSPLYIITAYLDLYHPITNAAPQSSFMPSLEHTFMEIGNREKRHPINVIIVRSHLSCMYVYIQTHA